MLWYKHDTNSTQDAKIKKLLLRHGPTGYAVYFHCLELIAADISDSNISFELEHDAEIIADNLKVKGTSSQSGIEIVEEIMRYIVELGLFEENENHHIFCFKMLKRLDLSMTSNKKFRSMISEAKASHDVVMIESCSSHDGVMKEEIRREEKRKEEITKESKCSSTKQLLSAYGIEGQLATDFINHRKAKKAAITETALNGFFREASKAGISIPDAVRYSIESNWQGFKADWYFNATSSGSGTKADAINARNKAVLDEWLAEQGEIHVSH